MCAQHDDPPEPVKLRTEEMVARAKALVTELNDLFEKLTKEDVQINMAAKPNPATLYIKFKKVL